MKWMVMDFKYQHYLWSFKSYFIMLWLRYLYLEISSRHTKNINGLYNPSKRRALCCIVLTDNSSASQCVSYIRDISHYMSSFVLIMPSTYIIFLWTKILYLY